jgi:AraC family transcriptional regulator
MGLTAADAGLMVFRDLRRYCSPMRSLVDHAAASIPDTARHSLGSGALSTLISLATATLDSDRATAKACLQRAAELLNRTIDGPPVQTKAAIGGGLAAWQQESVTAYIAAHVGSTIRVIDLARAARLSRGHFFQVFRQSFGETPLAHVTRQRIQHAQSLMLSSRAPLSQIALDCGMSDQPHFTRVFRRIVGINPGTWRRQFRTPDANADAKRTASIAARQLTTVPYTSRRIRA